MGEPQITAVSNSQILWKNRRLGCFLPVNQRTDGLWQGPPPLSADDSPPILRLAFMAAGSRPAAWLNDATASVSNSSQHSPSVAGHQLGHDVRDATHALLIRIPIPLNSTTPDANKRVIRV